MLIILEGPDGGGKTTLAEELRALLRCEVHRHGPYPDIHNRGSLARAYLDTMRAALEGEHAVLDRSWISEAVYGPIVRGGNRLPASHRRMLERVALGAGGVVVLARPALATCADAYMRRKGLEYLESTEQLAAVHAAFGEAAVVGADLPTIHYDRDQWQGRARDLARAVVAFAARCANPGPGGGAWRPTEAVLIIGDRANAKAAKPLKVPFVSFSGLGCSEWFADQLEEAKVPERALYWANAYAPDGRPLDGAWLQDLAPVHTTTVGRRAEEWLHDVGWNGPYTPVPHPQHHKRFFFGRPYPLIKELLRHVK